MPKGSPLSSAPVARRAFPPSLALLLAATVSAEGVATADHDGALASALTFRTATVGGRQVGILDWAMIDSHHRGRGLSTALGDGARGSGGTAATRS